jgi:hypothetical protein
MLTLRIEACFAKFGQTFRKTLPLDYKKGNKHTHRNTHALPMLVKSDLLKVWIMINNVVKTRWRLEEN